MNRTGRYNATSSVEGAVDPRIIAAIAGGGLLLIVLATGVRVIREYERGVVLRLGRRGPVRSPGMRYILPLGIDRMTRVDLRSDPLEVPMHEVMTRDGVPVEVSVTVHLEVLNPLLAITRVVDYRRATSQLAHAALRDVVATTGLRDLLLDQETMRSALASFITVRIEPWGLAATAVDLEDVVLPEALQRAMARHTDDRSEHHSEVDLRGRGIAAPRDTEPAAVIDPATRRMRA